MTFTISCAVNAGFVVVQNKNPTENYYFSRVTLTRAQSRKRARRAADVI